MQPVASDFQFLAPSLFTVNEHHDIANLEPGRFQRLDGCQFAPARSDQISL